MSKKEEIKKIETDFTDSFIEKIILNKVFTDKKYTLFFDKMYDKRWFDDDRISSIINLIISYNKKYSNIPNINILNELIKKYCEKTSKESVEFFEIFAECTNIKIEVDDASVKDNIEYFIRKKGVYYTILDGIEDIEKTKDVSKCIEKFEKINNISFDDDLGFEYFEQLDDHINYLINPDSKLPMGIKWLDDVTHGGLLKEGKCLAVFMAQPGLGKSLMLGNLAYRWLKQDKTVVIISCEMSKDVYGRRIDALISNDDIDELQITYKESFSKIKQFKAQHPSARLFIKEYPPSTIRSNDIKIYIDTLISRGIHPDVIIIDYLNLVLPNYSTGAGSYFDILQVSQNFRALSYLYKCPIVTATQANGEGINNANIGLEHISESKGTGHTGDFICALYQLAEDIEAGIINGKILKNRLGGKHGKVHAFHLNDKTLMLEDDECGDVIEIRKSDISSDNLDIVDDVFDDLN